MYSYIIEDNHECKKTKSINNNVVEDKLKYNDYKNFLLNVAYINHEMNRIRSKYKKIYTWRCKP